MRMRVFDGEFEVKAEMPIELIMSVEEARFIKKAIDELIEVAAADWTFHLNLPIKVRT